MNAIRKATYAAWKEFWRVLRIQKNKHDKFKDLPF
jgi:hypothetical protein